jgi:hypothetical protein
MKTGAKVFIAVLLTAAIAGGGVWYYQNQKAEKDKKALNDQITTLQNKTAQSTVTDDNPAGPTTDQVAVTWKTYKNGLYGFNLQYPSTWTLTEKANTGDEKSVVSLASPETTATYKAANGKEGVNPDDFSVYYYQTVADETENKTNSYGATSIDTLISTNTAIKKIGAVTFGGLPATDVYWGGLTKNYAILAMNQDHFFKIFLNNVSDKANLSDNLKKIIASFQFTN